LPKVVITPLAAKIFQQEAELAAILSHPNIIPVYEVGDADDFLYLAMQLVKGNPLSYYIEKCRKNMLPSKRTLPLETTFKIVISVLNAMEFAHSQNIIHRDIKPGNILIESYENRPIIVDFGMARVLRKPDETSDMIVGTPIYMAPEQIMDAEVDARADIYSIATMFFEMLNPEPLFAEISSIQELLEMKIEKKNGLFAKKGSELNSRLHEDIDAILSKALSFEPEARYATCRDFREQLENYADQYLKN